MKRVAATALTTLLAGLLGWSQLSTPVRAEPERRLMRPQDCRPYQPTADAQLPKAWHLERLQMKQVWRIATGKGITIAVLDTGFGYLGSPYFEGKVTAYDYLGGLSDNDRKAGGIDCDHGTKVASLIAAARPAGQPIDPRIDFSGIAPDAKLITYRVLSGSTSKSPEERDTLEATIAAIRDAIANKVDIINLSQAANLSDPLIPQFKAVIAEAIAQGIVVVAAAGNADQGLVGPAAPASFPGVISVGMVGPSDAPEELSYPGRSVTIGAPGSAMVALLPSVARDGASYANQAYEPGAIGTSFAAPIVSGIIALMLEADPSLTPAKIKQRLAETADPPPNTVPELKIGYGIVNPFRALAGVPRPQTPNPGAVASMPTDPLLTPTKPDLRPAYIGVGVGAAVLLLVSFALVTAIALPPAIRRAKSGAAAKTP